MALVTTYAGSGPRSLCHWNRRT